jgi:hypothetical protein
VAKEKSNKSVWALDLPKRACSRTTLMNSSDADNHSPSCMWRYAFATFLVRVETGPFALAIRNKASAKADRV